MTNRQNGSGPSKFSELTYSQAGVAMVEAAFILLAAGIALVGIIFWLVPAMTYQDQVSHGRGAVGLSTTLRLSIGRLGQGGQVIDAAIAEQSAQSLAQNLFENSGLGARAQAFQTAGVGSPASCAVTLAPVGGCITSTGAPCGGSPFGDPVDSPQVLDKIKAAAAAECLAQDFYVASEYEGLALRKTKGLQAVRKAGFQPDFFVPTGGSGIGGS